jgi:predicted phosphodiesterase
MKPGLLPKLTVILCAVLLSSSLIAQTRFINFGSSWKFLDNDTRPANWETTDYDDLSWSTGSGELGYGESDETTIVGFGPDANNKYITTYFRKTVNIPNPASFSNFTFNIERDDAFVLYVNGVEVGRNNMPAGAPTHSTFASAVEDDEIVSLIVPSTAFSATFNVIAVEIHQVNLTSSDLSFDLELIGNITGASLVDYGGAWRYFDLNSRPANWQTSTFDDGLWRIGYGELGFGEGDEATGVDGGPEGARYPTIYFRKKFTVADSAAAAFYVFNVIRDDGFVLYLNGVEVGRSNMPAGAITHNTFASTNIEEEVVSINIPTSLIRNGTNTLAVEMHQQNVNSTDLSFDLKLAGELANSKLLPFRSAWKYLNNNTRPANWETSGFDDALWSVGTGELGEGDGDEGTVISGGPGGAKYPAIYFRKTINIPDPAAHQSYTFSLERDDGYVIYVNGVEVHRNNMPAGAPTHATFATANVEDSILIFTLPNTIFTAGTNVIAVEVHQQNANSSDLSFDLEIVGNNSVQALIDAGSSWRYLDNNTTPSGWQNTSFADGNWRIGYGELGYGDGDEATVVSFGPNSGAKYITTYFRKKIVIPNASAFQNYTVSVQRDDGFILYVNGTERARHNMPGGAVIMTTPASTAVEDSIINIVLPASNFVNGVNVIAVEMHQNAGGSSDLSFDLQLFGNYAALPLIPFNSSWKYLDDNTRPASWETLAFNDGSWASGLARLGYGNDGEATTVSYGPDANNKYPTTYFRKTVSITNPSQYSSFIINLVRDDGAVVYVNGVEVVRSNMPAPPVTHNTFASTNIAGTAEQEVNSFVIPSSYFVNGNNVIAVEVHQDDATSSDLGFNLELVASNSNVPSPSSLITFTDVWKFLDNGTDQGTAWRTPAFNDASWNSGPAKLGFGDDLEATVINGGPVDNRHPTIYFRKTFTVTNLAQYQSFIITMMRDDGAIVYINGTEVVRENMPAGVVNYSTLASSTIDEGAEEETAVSFTIPTTAFVEGVNTIAVEIHQVNATSSDLGFSLELLGSQAPAPGGPVTLTRSPYLQRGTQSEITIRWRTGTPSDSRVEVGTSPGVYTQTVDDLALTTEHIVRVTGLNADTKYYYRIGTTTQVLQGNTDNFFTTVPQEGTRKVRIAAFGDCGRNENNFQANTLTRYRNYLSANGIDAADAWILLGDNAYNSGTENEFNTNFFNIYGPTILKNHKLYPAPGNHDYGSVNLETKVGPYYNLFTMPTQGEGGGVPSNTPAFYSYDIGDVHFLSLDSYGTEANKKMYDTTGAQVAWIKADLAANTKKWVVAYWHHPPYTKGSHNSDTETDLVAIRENFIRILERNGVDLIICGHSHDYERSYLLKGYYKANPGDAQVNENNFNPLTHTASTSSAKYDGSANSCPYIYKHGNNHHGTVYIVSGNAGADGGVQGGYPHDAFPYSDQNFGGMFYFEADSNRLDAKYIRSDGAIGDNFTIMKGVNVADTFFIISGNQVTLNASWGGNYAWSTTATTRTITVTPAEGLTNYSVVDNLGCLKDSFAVYANVCAGNVNTWVGNVSTAWENPANWSCGQVPTSNSEVVIIPGTPHAAIINSNVEIKNITIRTGASVTVTAGFKLDVKEPGTP